MAKRSGVMKDFLSKLQEKYPGQVALFGDMEKAHVKRISSGIPSLDIILGGGIPEGRVLEIFGPESSGKTTLAIKFLAEVQNLYPDKEVAFIDVEYALDPDYATNLGLDMDRVYLAYPNSAEEALNIMHDLAASGKFKAIILDSVAALVPASEYENEVGKAEMGMRARLIGQALRKIVPQASNNECTCFFINQVRVSMASYGNPETRPGGKALPYAASVVIRTSTKKSDVDGEGLTTMRVSKNKVGRPGGKTIVHIKYGEGFDIMQDLLDTCVQYKIIEKKGGHYSYGDKYKWHGEDAVKKELGKNIDLVKELYTIIQNSIGTYVPEEVSPDAE